MIKLFKRFYKGLKYRINAKKNILLNEIISKKIIESKILANQNLNKLLVSNFSEIEYTVFSQWGEDGIINWLTFNIENIPKTFIEFGVENYSEANTRLLFQEYNWEGLIIDGDKKNIVQITESDYYWKGNLKTICSFVDRENINEIIKKNFLNDELGLLSIDVDGNDYWIWESIININPVIVICEYNGIFGKKLKLSVPYDKKFNRSKAHYSHLYFGCSIQALISLADKKGYEFLGSNLNGNNAFFIKKNYYENIRSKLKEIKIHDTKFRESRNINQKLNFLNSEKGLKLIENLPVFNFSDKKKYYIRDIKKDII